eukprot:CAMPEP_0117678852 /NCGR_PEP_ID=MMETSP0804-20121206/17515_1 /TAXON_ID=1074897 /ORGANISM="Tetraselmis astigmatica, Strain CCMP880" /LENGTH=151 /DNA_ID=CAMNT_0005488261 /DNA_START=327 /DNA_END=782 /DNA_ORIENTATION=-
MEGKQDRRGSHPSVAVGHNPAVATEVDAAFLQHSSLLIGGEVGAGVGVQEPLPGQAEGARDPPCVRGPPYRPTVLRLVAGIHHDDLLGGYLGVIQHRADFVHAHPELLSLPARELSVHLKRAGLCRRGWPAFGVPSGPAPIQDVDLRMAVV